VRRQIDFGDDAVVIRYGTLDAILRTVAEVRVPSTSIGSISIGLHDPPRALAFRIGYSTPPFGTTQRGRFREQGSWSFIDVDDRERAVVLDLSGHRFRRVALTVDDPEAFTTRLRGHRPERG
jgi:hypothetical protein